MSQGFADDSEPLILFSLCRRERAGEGLERLDRAGEAGRRLEGDARFGVSTEGGLEGDYWDDSGGMLLIFMVGSEQIKDIYP